MDALALPLNGVPARRERLRADLRPFTDEPRDYDTESAENRQARHARGEERGGQPGAETTPRLAFPKPLEGEQYTQLVEYTFRSAFAEDRLSYQDTLGERIRVGWRLARELAELKGLCAQEDMLVEGLEPFTGNVDPWLQPTKWRPPPYLKQRGVFCLEAIQLLQQFEEIEQDDCYCTYDFADQQPVYHPGTAVLPPPVPDKWIEERGQLSVAYREELDPCLMLYVRLLDAIARHLYIEKGSPSDPDYGRYGLTGLLDARHVRLVFPSKAQLVAWEGCLIEETVELLVEKGIKPTRKVLYARHGFQNHEINSLIKMARVAAQREMEADVEEDRAIMLQRLESLATRARDALDLRTELAAIKQSSIILGLAKTQTDDALSDFLQVVRSVSAERQTKRLAAEDVRVLPTGTD